MVFVVLPKTLQFGRLGCQFRVPMSHEIQLGHQIGCKRQRFRRFDFLDRLIGVARVKGRSNGSLGSHQSVHAREHGRESRSIVADPMGMILAGRILQDLTAAGFVNRALTDRERLLHCEFIDSVSHRQGALSVFCTVLLKAIQKEIG